MPPSLVLVLETSSFPCERTREEPLCCRGAKSASWGRLASSKDLIGLAVSFVEDRCRGCVSIRGSEPTFFVIGDRGIGSTDGANERRIIARGHAGKGDDDRHEAVPFLRESGLQHQDQKAVSVGSVRARRRVGWARFLFRPLVVPPPQRLHRSGGFPCSNIALPSDKQVAQASALRLSVALLPSDGSSKPA